MVFVGSVGLGIPEHHVTQEEVKKLVQHIFLSNRKLRKLLPVFDNAKVASRQLVVDKSWFKKEHTFAEANQLYFSSAKQLSLQAIDSCLKSELLTDPIPYDAIDMIVFVSSTGITTPSLDAYLLNERPFREDIVRMPLWGLGCAGGAIGLSRAFEWIRLHPEKVALVVCCELCSLTFQKNDFSTSNLVGTAIFGDGAGATILIGERSPFKEQLTKKLRIKNTHSFTKKNSTTVMGWDVTANGLEVIFSKRIPKLVESIWKDHVLNFLKKEQMDVHHLSAIIAHPGGRKVLEEMERTLRIQQNLLHHSYTVLKNHGNMSSATVLYVLKKWFQNKRDEDFEKKLGILCALGPGFSSELLLLEWME
ncbi:type III polyketide synthase [Pseudogracilibacillus auburnensis]|uniref:15-methylpalmitoyl-4-hydroxy-2-pyrone synthase n=1 Tax=Pseudogracilibacillus auburnensis TaxID=1494959 RepID=A0A2V3VU31_9BACI|nr:3-oxoacyl-[acyl-carrier-protein] synthase III C-terminal domain-containing protein [Pseudogracilibacillus auburnensis]MBO1004618.1 type III polyketide synthase [Pseudogracilibacillus auburnensis]PXW85170.1 15-methylpalmitoyl-4-hydroxy-2-pyrone synthase [Pseudogracilibacillus auburnensis]